LDILAMDIPYRSCHSAAARSSQTRPLPLAAFVAGGGRTPSPIGTAHRSGNSFLVRLGIVAALVPTLLGILLGSLGIGRGWRVLAARLGNSRWRD
jgi:hypothetical protein